jgi:hypothetical protein
MKQYTYYVMAATKLIIYTRMYDLYLQAVNSSSPLDSVSIESADMDGESSSCKTSCVSDLFFRFGRHLMAEITGSDVTN